MYITLYTASVFCGHVFSVWEVFSDHRLHWIGEIPVALCKIANLGTGNGWTTTEPATVVTCNRWWGVGKITTISTLVMCTSLNTNAWTVLWPWWPWWGRACWCLPLVVNCMCASSHLPHCVETLEVTAGGQARPGCSFRLERWGCKTWNTALYWF